MISVAGCAIYFYNASIIILFSLVFQSSAERRYKVVLVPQETNIVRKTVIIWKLNLEMSNISRFLFTIFVNLTFLHAPYFSTRYFYITSQHEMCWLDLL